MINALEIHKSFGAIDVIKGISFSINSAEIVAIVGPSGAGKTTLLQILGTLDRPYKGKISFNGNDPFDLNDRELSRFRNKNIGFIFQFHQLLPEFTAIENIMIPAMIAGTDKKAMIERSRFLLERVGLSKRAEHKPAQLSGGEQQRVAICRALINSPAVILADEPSGNLDSNNASDLHNLFLEMRKEFNQTMVVVTHNKELAEMADRQLKMKDGMLE
jgi:lipoprotein-releasing system ATP-binding protein